MMLRFLYTTKYTLYLTIGGILFFGLCAPAFAQFQIPGEPGATIEFEPMYPAPGTAFKARLTTYNRASGDTVAWYENGALISEGSGQHEVTLTAPFLGETMRIRATVSGSQAGTVERTLAPAAVDVVVEGDTMAPYFYEGSRVPSTGSNVRISAIPHLFTTAGARLHAPELNYVWSLNNVIMEEGIGKDTFSFTLPSLTRSLITLAVASQNDAVRYEKYFYVEEAAPNLAFYTYRPLLGLSRNAVTDAYLYAETPEVTVRAEPYFISSDVYADALYSWSINGTDVANQSTDPQVITLASNGTSGVSDIGFSIRNLKALSQYAQGLFRIEFR